uniref:Ig-like domain-containing protein n=1 Tax=Macrostomum lignano TaxID=282301 RepID=A0A1I8FHI9_9PLAT
GTKLVHKMESRLAPIVSFVREEEGRGGRPGAKSVIEGVPRDSGELRVRATARALDSEGRLWTWGFDELRPRLVNYFSNTRQRVDRVSVLRRAPTLSSHYGAGKSLCAASHLSVGTARKAPGEATICIPKALMDLSGWSIRPVCRAQSQLRCTGRHQLHSRGAASPTFGELGHGDMVKSSARPMVCKALERVRVAELLWLRASAYFCRPLKSDGSDAEEKLGKYPVVGTSEF